MFINNLVLLRLNIALFYVGYTCCLTVAIKQICYVMSSTNTSMKYYRSILLLLSGILRAAQSVLGVYFKRTSSRDTSASSARGRILNDSALYKSTLSLTHSLTGILWRHRGRRSQTKRYHVWSLYRGRWRCETWTCGTWKCEKRDSMEHRVLHMSVHCRAGMHE